MTTELPEDARSAFDRHDAFEPEADGYRLTTTAFDVAVTATARDDYATDYEVRVDVPTLANAVTDQSVGDAVQRGWLETFERRLADAPTSTRVSVELDEFEVTTADGTVTVVYGFAFGDAGTAADVAKTFAEYVEGTYVEGVIPGYEYGEPVTGLLGAAATGNDGERGGTPL